jgi:hypothetical protein
LRHTTHYQYSGAVTLSHNEARILPRVLPWQDCSNTQLVITPIPDRMRERIDFFGNRVVYFSIESLHESLDVTVTSEIVTHPRASADIFSSISWEQAAEELRHDPRQTNRDALDARLYVLDSPFIFQSPGLADYARSSFPPGRNLVDAVLELNQRIFSEFTYDPEFTTLATPLQDVLASKRGVCQDFAHLGIGCLRSLGLAARYVSGYMETLPPPGQQISLSLPRGENLRLARPSDGVSPHSESMEHETLFSALSVDGVLAVFAARFPDVQAQLVLTDAPANLVEDGFDLQIKFGEPTATRNVMALLLRNRRVLIASPEYLRAHGRPKRLSDLEDHACIALRQEHAAYDVWRFGDDDSVRIRSGLSTNDGEIAVSWVLGGHGIMLRSEWDIARHVRAGRLEVVLPRHAMRADIFAVYPERLNLSAKVRMFIDILRDRIREQSSRLQLP